MSSLLHEAARAVREGGPSRLLYQVRRFLWWRLTAVWLMARYGRTFHFERSVWLDLARDSERPILVDLLSNLRDGDVFYDIGANQGAYSVKVAKLIGDDRVYAFEPGPVVEELRANLRQVGVDVTIIEKAVSQGDDDAFEYRLYEDRVLLKGGHADASEEAVVPDAIDGEAILEAERFPLPTVMKIDVNGFDLDALRAIRPVLAEGSCRLLYIEIEPPDANNVGRHPPIYELTDEDLVAYFERSWSFDDMVILLTRLGFKLEYMTDLTGDIFIKAFR